MGVELTYYYGGSYAYFELSDTITFKDIEDIFKILSNLLHRNKPFVFLLDSTKIKEFPTFKAGYHILSWMKKNYSIIPGRLLGSSVILDNSIIISILNWVFTHRKPVSPNIITNDLQKGKDFLKNLIPVNLDLKKNVLYNYDTCQTEVIANELTKEKQIKESVNIKND